MYPPRLLVPTMILHGRFENPENYVHPVTETLSTLPHKRASDELWMHAEARVTRHPHVIHERNRNRALSHVVQPYN